MDSAVLGTHWSAALRGREVGVSLRPRAVSIGGDRPRASGQHLVEKPRASQIDSDVEAQESPDQVTGFGERDSPEGKAAKAVRRKLEAPLQRSQRSQMDRHQVLTDSRAALAHRTAVGDARDDRGIRAAAEEAGGKDRLQVSVVHVRAPIKVALGPAQTSQTGPPSAM